MSDDLINKGGFGDFKGIFRKIRQLFGCYYVGANSFARRDIIFMPHRANEFAPT